MESPTLKINKGKVEKRKQGQPPKFSSPKELKDKFDLYATLCDEKKQIPEKAGLCLFLGICRDTYSEYRKKPDFSDTVKSIDLYIESNWIRRLTSNAPTGAIFYLKNAFKETYKDRQEVDNKHSGSVIYLPQKK